MTGKNIFFDDRKINKKNFYRSKKLFSIYDIEVYKILISKKEPNGKKSSFKYFLGYNDDDVISFLRFLQRHFGVCYFTNSILLI